MKRLSVILYIFLLAFFAGVLPTSSFAAVPCQVIYGGGQICQGQPSPIYSFPPQTPTPTPTTVQSQVPTTSHLPATGPSMWGLVLIGLSGIGGVVLLLL